MVGARVWEDTAAGCGWMGVGRWVWVDGCGERDDMGVGEMGVGETSVWLADGVRGSGGGNTRLLAGWERGCWVCGRTAQ